MLTDGVRVLCQGFHPSERTEARLYEWADELQTEAPGDACVKAVMSRHGREYQAEVRITSRAGMFHTIAKGPNLFSITRDAMKSVRRQFKKWKTLRHQQHYRMQPARIG